MEEGWKRRREKKEEENEEKKRQKRKKSKQEGIKHFNHERRWKRRKNGAKSDRWKDEKGIEERVGKV